MSRLKRGFGGDQERDFPRPVLLRPLSWVLGMLERVGVESLYIYELSEPTVIGRSSVPNMTRSDLSSSVEESINLI
jgi:hypothetical protein